MAERASNSRAWRDAASAGENCLSPYALDGLLEGSQPNAEQAQHVAGCPHCQAELAMMRSFESSAPIDNEGAAVAWITAQLQRRQGMPAAPPMRMPLWRSFFRLPYLAAAMAVALIFGLGLSLYISHRQQPPVLTAELSGPQAMRSGAVRLTAPSGELTQAPEEFRWEQFGGATRYTVELMEVDGSVIWSAQTEQPALTIGPDLHGKLQPGKRLFWKVIALNASGKTLATSNQGEFRIKLAEHRNR